MNITKATVLKQVGMDLVILQTEFPSAVPAVTDQKLQITFNAAYDTGEQYVKDNFPGVPINLIPRAH